MAYVFRGGIYFKNGDTAASGGIKRPEYEQTLYVPLGEAQQLLIPAGSHVMRGQMIAGAADGVAALHSPVSGTVLGTELIAGVVTVKIENDGHGTVSPDIAKMKKKLSDCTPEEIIGKIRDAGICGMCSGQPTADKLSRAVGNVGTCIINCSECEPYIACDLGVLAERTSDIVNGLKIFLRALGIRRGVIAVPEGNGDVIKKLGELTKNGRMISVMKTSDKYPQGDDRRIVYALTGRELRPSADPITLGCVVFNVQTCVAVYDAFVTGMPLTRRVVTVGGDCVSHIVNVEVPIGTPYSALVEYAGGVTSDPELILDGGPLRGHPTGLDRTVGKTTRALLMMSRDEIGANGDTPVCIRCGRCVSACPERLMPNYIYNCLRDGKTDSAIAFGALACVGCGICSYICPGKAPVSELIADFRRKRREYQKENGADNGTNTDVREEKDDN